MAIAAFVVTVVAMVVVVVVVEVFMVMVVLWVVLLLQVTWAKTTLLPLALLMTNYVLCYVL